MSATPPGVVERLLAERIGLDPSSVGDGLIARGVHARMSSLGLRSKADYERALLDSGDELQALVEEVVVPESWFFRDDRPFEVLADFARDGLAGRPGPPALAASEHPLRRGRGAVLDRDDAARSRPARPSVPGRRRGRQRPIAGPGDRRGLRPELVPGGGLRLRSTYFREQNGAFTLDPAVRSTVRFHLGNLLDPALFADRPTFDMIFCRNLLIYFDDEAQAAAFATLDRLLVEGGLLFLGHAERLDDPEGSPFEPTGGKGSFAYRKGEARPKQAKPTPKRPPRRSLLPPLLARGRGEGDRQIRSGRRPRRSHVSPARSRGRGRRTVRESSADARLAEAVALADQGRYDEAAALVRAGHRRRRARAPRRSSCSGLIAPGGGRLATGRRPTSSRRSTSTPGTTRPCSPWPCSPGVRGTSPPRPRTAAGPSASWRGRSSHEHRAGPSRPWSTTAGTGSA